MMANPYVGIRGQKIKGSHGLARYKTCDRCGRSVTRDRPARPDRLMLCLDCTGDRWYIDTVRAKQSA